MSDIYLYNNEMWKVKYKFTYTGDKEQFQLNPGRYLCICKGAKGGALESTYKNKGGCSYGILNLESPLTAYAVVGGDGGNGSMESPGDGGYNGGGHGGHSCRQGTYHNGSGGGGGTDIRLTSTDYKEGITQKTIPDEYDEIEWIQSDGSQHIDIDTIHKANTKIECICEIISNTDRSWEAVFGARYSSTSRQMVFFSRFSGNNIPCYGCGNYETRGSNLLYDQKIRISIDSNVVSWYDSTDTLVGSITGNTQEDGNCPMYLFDLNNNGRPDGSRSKVKLYSFKMTTDGELVRYLVPFKNKGVMMDIGEPVFEQGTISDTGRDVSASNRIRSIGYIPIDTSYQYMSIFTEGTSILDFNLMVYNDSFSVIQDTPWANAGKIVTLPSGSAYIRIVIGRRNSGSLTPADLTSVYGKYYINNVSSGLYDLVSDRIFRKGTGNEFFTGDVVSEKTHYDIITQIPVGYLSRIMVAGGGGGQGWQNIYDNNYSDFTGFGGGVYGGYPHTKTNLVHNHEPSSQTSGYNFGIGEDAVDKNTSTPYATFGCEGIGGGGGGWYGGFTSNVPSPNESYSVSNGGGGSGYILTETSYRPEGYMTDITPRDDIEFSNTLMTSGLSNESCVIICEPVTIYGNGDRLICDCIGSGTSFPLYGGQYKIKCAGGSGSHRYKTTYASHGGYAEGILENKNLITAYAYVGGSGLYAAADMDAAYVQTTHPTLCFNGGGTPAAYGSVKSGGEAAGGGTDLRLTTDSLLSRVIVAGGAGGSGGYDNYGGVGGGLSGGSYNSGSGTNYGPGTQTEAGAGERVEISGGFGYGGNGNTQSSGNYYGGAGGGGWYGGSGTYPTASNDVNKGGCGGSGYVLTETSYKPDGYLLDYNYYLSEPTLESGSSDTLCEFPLSGLIIEVINASTMQLLARDRYGYKYYDQENNSWAYLGESVTVDDFINYGVNTFDDDTGLEDEYEIYILDQHDMSNVMNFNILPPKQSVKFRYRTPYMLSRFITDSDVDESVVDFNVTATRTGIAEDAYIHFNLEYDIHDIPNIKTRVYSVQGFTQGNSFTSQESNKKEKTKQHIDLLPVGSSTRMPTRFKNYIGSFINTIEAITSITSALACEHNRCIYTATLCNDSIVRFAKLNLVSNESTIIKDIPKNQIGDSYYGDIKVDDDYIYLSCCENNATSNIRIWRTPNSADTTVNTYSVTDANEYRINAGGRMEWIDNHTIVIMMQAGLAYFDTATTSFTYKMSNGVQNSARRDMAVGNKYILSLDRQASDNAYIIERATNVWRSMKDYYGISWNSSALSSGCYNDGKFYVVQRNRLHILDEESMTIINSYPTPFTDIDPKQIVYAKGVLYITILGASSLYIFDLKTETFTSVGLPFSVDNWNKIGWIRMCSFKGYCFVPQIRLFVVNFVDNSKYNLGYKYNRFIAIMNKTNSEVPDSQYEYDDRFVTFTDDNMTISDGTISVDMIESDPENHIKLVPMSKDQYNKIIKTTFSKIEHDEFIDDEIDEESEGI